MSGDKLRASGLQATEVTELGKLRGEVAAIARTANAVLAKVDSQGAHIAGILVQQELARRELANLAALVQRDHAPRITAVEKAALTPAQKARVAGKWGALLVLAPLAGQAVAKAWPQQADLINQIQSFLQLLGAQ